MYLQGHRRMNGMGLAISLPSIRYDSSIRPVIRPVAPAPIPTVNQPIVSTTSTVIKLPVTTPRPPILPAPMPPVTAPPVSANSGTPVPSGYSTNQIFVNTDGSFWQYSPSQAKWINVGTPYNTGASATPPAPPPSSSGASTAAPAGTTAPPPVNVSIAPAAASSGYQEIFDWLQQDSLLSSIGFAGIPNWIVAGGGALLLYKVTSGGKR